MLSTYEKPFLSLEEQLGCLVDRGMDVGDPERALRSLQAIGYYRLSGYWYPFRAQSKVPGPRPSQFVEGTTLDQVLEIYRFDERLRAEMLRAIARIEIALRFWVGHRLGKRGPFAHMDPIQLDPVWAEEHERRCKRPNCSADCSWWDSEHEQWVGKQRRVEKISSEAFVAHIYENYGGPLPVWTATETMTFESLNRLYAGMAPQDREQVAAEFDVFRDDGNGDASSFANWLEHLRQSRNVCAHHARLWNRNHTAPLAVPESSAELQHLLSPIVDESGSRNVSPASRRTYGTLTLVAFLLARIDDSNDVRNDLVQVVLSFAAHYPERLKAMGFPDDWKDQAIWGDDYGLSAEAKAHAKLLRQVDLLYTKDAAERLGKKPTEAERRSLLGYYRKNGALLSVPGTQAHRFPSFQFDLVSGDAKEIVILANRRLLDGGVGSEQQRWSALKWWVTPIQTPGQEESPLTAVEAGTLTRVRLDKILLPRDDE